MSLHEVYIRALRYLGTHRRQVALITAVNILLAILTIAEPVLFGRIIDAITDNQGIEINLVLWATFGIFNAVALVLVARAADRLAHQTRAEVLTASYGRIITMPPAWHAECGAASAIHVLMRATETLFGLWLEFMRQHLSTAVALLLLIPTAFAMDARLSVVLLALGAAYVVIGRLVMHRTRVGQASVERHYQSVFSHISDTIANVSVIHGYDRVRREMQALAGHVDHLLAAQYPVLDWWALATALHRMAATLSMVIILVLGTFLVTSGEMRVGEVIAFVGFANLLIVRLDQLSAFATQIFEARAKLEEFYALEDSAKTNVTADTGIHLGFDTPPVQGAVKFENISFAFNGQASGVSDISFEARPGETVAIVGPTGSGKTTLMNLLQGIYKAQKGRILIDGTDIATVSRRSLRQSIATVFQDSGLFNRSIGDNIRVGREEASHYDILLAADAAAASDFIEMKPSGYDSIVGERGSALSGGERQRLAIARAILKNAPILVLDEATSALDVETEARVKMAIDFVRKNRTTFVIAHRLSTVRDADRVIVMDQGHILETGSFEELSRSNGRFASLLRTSGIHADLDMLTDKPNGNERKIAVA